MKEKFGIGEKVKYSRGNIKGISNVQKIIRAELVGKIIAHYYVLDYHPNGEIFRESELRRA